MRSCLKYHGGKYYLRHELLELMPPHHTYVEPFFGGGQFFFFKPPSKREIINDSNPHLMQMWETIKLTPKPLIDILQKTPYDESSFDGARYSSISGSPEEHAAKTFILYRQSLGGRGKSFGKSSHNRLRRGMPDNESAWLSAIDLIAPNSSRLDKVDISIGNALDILRNYDGDDSLFYLDPPYLPETRVSKLVYENEMGFAEHEHLLQTIIGLKGKVMLSGYESPLYDQYLQGWKRTEINVPNNAAGGIKKKRSFEIIWTKL